MTTASQWSLVCHSTYQDKGVVSVVKGKGRQFVVLMIESDDAVEPCPDFLGMSEQDEVILINPQTKAISCQKKLPSNAYPAYAYRDPKADRIWFMKDGDKDTGNDVLSCGDKGSSVTIISNGADSAAVFEKTVCVGRGHHVTTFVDNEAFVSNLVDGSISVMGNDPADEASYLKVKETINLFLADKESASDAVIPNNAFPHGKVFSAVTGKIYSLSNGYNMVSVIDPASRSIDKNIEMKVSSNLLLSQDGRFIIGKGADRKADPEHVMGRLTVLDVSSGEISGVHDLKDVYPSVYRFNPEGSKLYVTTAATGKSTQRDNLNKTGVLIYDTTNLPAMPLLKEVEVGVADCGRRPIAFFEEDGKASLVFIPNPTDGTISILDGETDEVIDTVSIGEAGINDLNFSFWDGSLHGA